MVLNNYIQQRFQQKFESNCYKLLISAYQQSLKEKIIKLDWDENDISQELYEKIDGNPSRRNYKIFVTREKNKSKKGKKKKGFANKLPRIDFEMSCFSLTLEYKFYAEAKRLEEKSSKLKRAYINEGMDRFILGKYPKGVMLGYLLAGDVSNTVSGINKLLKKDKRQSEILKAVSNIHKDYFESDHTSIGTLKHFIFDYTNI